MTKLEKVIKGIEIHLKPNSRCIGCPYPNNGLCGDQLYRDALELLKERQWVSVKDRLPDNKSRYLCACFDYVTKTYWIDVLWRVSGSWWARLSTMGTDKDYNDHVRYWMPLPEPPKEE